MRTIRPMLNLDNIRCFLYGYGEHEIDDGTSRYAKAVLYIAVNGHEAQPILNRSIFLKKHFGKAFDVSLNETYLNAMEEKRKNEFIAEICNHKGSRRGQVVFLDKISENYAKNKTGFSLDELTQYNENILKQWDLSQFDSKLLDLIQNLKEILSNEVTDSRVVAISYLLERIQDMAFINVHSLQSTKNSAKVLALLLLTALLWEKFPFSLLQVSPVFTTKQRYHLENLFAGIQINLNALNMQLNAQEAFLKYLRDFIADIDTSDSVIPLNINLSLKQYYSLQLLNIEKAHRMMDYSDLSEEYKAIEIEIDHSSIFFLHSAAFNMDEFARVGLCKVLEYIQLFHVPSVLSKKLLALIESYEKCLFTYRKLVYWELVALCRGLNFDIVKDMNQYAGYFAPEETKSFALAVKMNKCEIDDKLVSTEQDFRRAISMTLIDFPKVFYSVGITKVKEDIAPQKAGMMWSLSGKENDCAEKAIIDAFILQYRRMDSVCNIHDHMLGILQDLIATEGQVSAAVFTNYNSLLKNHKELLFTISNTPPIVVKPPLSTYMKAKNIKTLEFQGACAYIYELALDCLLHITQIESVFKSPRNVPGYWATLQQYYNNAQSAYKSHILFLNTLPNYLFSCWDKKWIEYLYCHIAKFQILCFNPEHWLGTQAAVERHVTEVLNKMEDDLLEFSRMIVKETWSLEKMKSNIEQMRSSLHSTDVNAPTPNISSK